MMGDVLFVIFISSAISMFVVMTGTVAWSMFEETRLGRWIVDGLIGKRKDKDDETD